MTSSVEDAFFVVSKSVRRVLATQNHSVVCACLNNAAGVLGDVFLPAQSKQLSDASPVRAFQIAKGAFGATRACERALMAPCARAARPQS